MQTDVQTHFDVSWCHMYLYMISTTHI